MGCSFLPECSCSERLDLSPFCLSAAILMERQSLLFLSIILSSAETNICLSHLLGEEDVGHRVFWGRGWAAGTGLLKVPDEAKLS